MGVFGGGGDENAQILFSSLFRAGKEDDTYHWFVGRESTQYYFAYVGNKAIQLVGIIDVDYSGSPRIGFEPTTNRLTADRSTAELPRKVVGDSVSYTLGNLCPLNHF